MKIIHILNNLESSQADSFSLYMKSPFFCIEKESKQLYKLIAPFLKKRTLSSISPGLLFEQYCSKYESLSSAQFSKLCFRFRAVIDQFLAHDALAKNKAQKKHLAVTSYGQMPETKFYRTVANKELQLLEQSTKKGRLQYFQLFQSQFDLYFHPVTLKKETKAGDLLHTAQKNLDRFYILSKLQIAIELLYRNKTMEEKHEVDLINQLVELSKKETSPIFDLYRLLINLLRNEYTEEDFLKVKQEFKNQLPFLDRKDKPKIMTILLNESAYYYSRGQLVYLNHLIEIYELGLKHKLLWDSNGQLSQMLFTNITILYSLNKDFDSAYYFIQSNKKHLAPETRKNTVNFSWAYIHFYSGEFKKAWSLLLQVTFKITDYKIQHRSLLLRCYYESITKDKTLRKTLLKELKNFRKFIYRLPLSFKLHKTPYYNQISVIRALTEFDPEVDDQKSFQKKWRKFITENPPATKKWLIDKIEELSSIDRSALPKNT